jgi:acyl-CoA reductase-like NAD-dependent aldehyde dehydrogenase
VAARRNRGRRRQGSQKRCWRQTSRSEVSSATAVNVAAGAALPVINPATEKVIAVVREAGADEVGLAVNSARASFADGRWRRTSVRGRQDVLLRLRDLILKHADELAQLECTNTGLPLAQIKGLMVPRAAQNFAFFAEYIGERAEQLYRQETGFLTLVTREATGVAALISPWNAPIALTTMKIAGCIAFGNSCVVKPSEQTPSPIARLMELIVEAGARRASSTWSTGAARRLAIFWSAIPASTW